MTHKDILTPWPWKKKKSKNCVFRQTREWVGAYSRGDLERGVNLCDVCSLRAWWWRSRCLLQQRNFFRSRGSRRRREISVFEVREGWIGRKERRERERGGGGWWSPATRRRERRTHDSRLPTGIDAAKRRKIDDLTGECCESVRGEADNARGVKGGWWG